MAQQYGPYTGGYGSTGRTLQNSPIQGAMNPGSQQGGGLFGGLLGRLRQQGAQGQGFGFGQAQGGQGGGTPGIFGGLFGPGGPLSQFFNQGQGQGGQQGGMLGGIGGLLGGGGFLGGIGGQSPPPPPPQVNPQMPTNPVQLPQGPQVPYGQPIDPGMWNQNPFGGRQVPQQQPILQRPDKFSGFRR